VGLGAIVTGARRITEPMFMGAARTLAELVTEADLAQGSLYPPLASIREVSAKIGAAVAEIAFRDGLASVPRPPDLLAFVKAQMYEPRYGAERAP
jgi:malate dehydrogenase (oxaloacetate-decarboxylating)(NADP+)